LLRKKSKGEEWQIVQQIPPVENRTATKRLVRNQDGARARHKIREIWVLWQYWAKPTKIIGDRSRG